MCAPRQYEDDFLSKAINSAKKRPLSRASLCSPDSVLSLVLLSAKKARSGATSALPATGNAIGLQPPYQLCNYFTRERGQYFFPLKHMNRTGAINPQNSVPLRHRVPRKARERQRGLGDPGWARQPRRTARSDALGGEKGTKDQGKAWRRRGSSGEALVNNGEPEPRAAAAASARGCARPQLTGKPGSRKRQPLPASEQPRGLGRRELRAAAAHWRRPRLTAAPASLCPTSQRHLPNLGPTMARPYQPQPRNHFRGKGRPQSAEAQPRAPPGGGAGSGRLPLRSAPPWKPRGRVAGEDLSIRVTLWVRHPPMVTFNHKTPFHSAP